MKKNPSTNIENVSVKVVQALENPRWSYRTALGIAKETQLPMAQVEYVLSQNTDAVRVSLVKSVKGKTLYASKKKVSAIGDVWTAFRAVNKERYGR
jgi:hypothetical protein